MKSFLLTLLPMSLVAIFVLFGGERLAQQEREERIPINQKRFTNIAFQFSCEIERLQKLYQKHLDELGYIAFQEKGFAIKDAMNDISGVYSLHLIDSRHRRHDISLNTSKDAPEIIIEGNNRIQPSKNSIITLPKSAFSTPINSAGNYNSYWSPKTNNGFCVYLTRPAKDTSVIILIDLKVTQKAEQIHLKKMVQEPLVAIKRNKEILAIKHGNSIIASTGKIPESLPSSFIPIRNNTGQWDIQAWDRVNIIREYNTAILSSAVILSLSLLGAGFFLFSHQQRALKLAENRVSFVNRVSHELGTPLTNICLNLDLAEEDLELNPEKAQKRLGIVKEEVGRLGRLVSNVLTFAKFKKQRIITSPHLCNPTDIITQVLETYKPALLRRGFKIETDIDETPNCLIDGDALSQIASNLISNVEKYAAEGKWINLICSHKEETLILEVIDNGPAISKNKKYDIFKPFIRSRDDTIEGASGAGLGLAISRDLSENMAGKLVLIPSKKGFHFKLIVPCPIDPNPSKENIT